MAKINIAGVKKTIDNYIVHIVVTELQQVEGETIDATIDEAFLVFPHDLEMPKIQEGIEKAAKDIMDRHKDSLDKRKDIEELELPEIT